MPHRAITYRPAWPLGCFVRAIWYYEGYTQPHAFERLMPDGSMNLVMNLDEDCVRLYDLENRSKSERLCGATFMGAHQKPFVIDTAEQRHVIGVQFVPGGAFPFLRMPADELQGRHVALEDVWGTSGRRLRERLLELPSLRARCRFMEEELIARAAGRLLVRDEVRYAARAFEDVSTRVADVVDATGLSARRFAEIFRAAVGLTPKAYARVRRFQTSLQAVASSAQHDWAEIALACGYFDQAHFNHDFRAFSGISPSKYVSIDKRHINHVPF